MPYGCRVLSLRIQYVSRLFLALSVQRWSDSMTHSSMSVKECDSDWKCSATGDLLNRFILQSDLCRFILRLIDSLVSPTYCLLQTVQDIKYTALLVLQLYSPLIDDLAPMLLLNTVMGFMSWHVWHLDTSQGPECPVLGVSSFELTFALTRMSRRDFGLR